MASLKIRLLTLVLYITVVEWHVKSRRFSARLIRPFIRYSGRRPSYIILSSPYTCAQLRIVLVHFFVASNVARYSAFNTINGTCVYFSNTSIMEYCLASYAISEPTLYELMTAKGNRSNFIHELSFYSGIIPDCSKLLNSLNDEITSTILENMDILDEIEKLSINLEFDIKKDTFKEAIINNRYSIEEVDELTELKTFDQEHSPMKISKINSVEESESFIEVFINYRNFDSSDTL